MDADKSKIECSLFPEDRIRHLMQCLLSALHHIHTNNIVHRDMKPENCLIDENWTLRIIDFGLSKDVKQHEEGNLLLGTPYFLAPEVHNL